MSFIQEMIRAWRRNGVDLNPGASDNELDALRELFNCEVPADIREFYAGANGMATDVYDEHHVSMRPIANAAEP